MLVVDDDRRMVKTICDILRVKGYEADAAFTGEEAVEKVKASDFDCVLMEIKMPGISGVEALQMIKAASPYLPVVLMSAYTTDEQVEAAKERGADAVLTKPVDLQMVFSFLALLRKEESILIVDDDPEFCNTLKDVLQNRHFNVQTEADPAKVLGKMEESYKLAVVLDLKLGEADGLEVLKSIRAKYPSKPVVLVTGYREEMAESIEKGMKIGAYTCLYKPFVTGDLVGTIENISAMKRRAVLCK